jgi:hypothetical protein
VLTLVRGGRISLGGRWQGADLLVIGERIGAVGPAVAASWTAAAPTATGRIS